MSKFWDSGSDSDQSDVDRDKDRDKTKSDVPSGGPRRVNSKVVSSSLNSDSDSDAVDNRLMRTDKERRLEAVKRAGNRVRAMVDDGEWVAAKGAVDELVEVGCWIEIRIM